MKEIKTIIERRDLVDEFDHKVNSALDDGFKLIRRYIDKGFGGEFAKYVFFPCLVAEMEREVVTDETESIG